MQIYSTANCISRSVHNFCRYNISNFFFLKKWHALKFPLFGINCILKIVKSVPAHLDRIPILYFFILKMPKISKSVLKTACTPDFYTYFLRLYTLKCRNRRLKKPGHLDRIPILYFFILKMPKISKSVLKTACTPDFYTYFLRLYTLKCRNRRLKKPGHLDRIPILYFFILKMP